MTAEAAAIRPRVSRLEGSMGAVDAALEAWARWARRALGDLGWPPMTLLARVIESGVSGAAQQGGTPLEQDELCEAVERGILRLSEQERRVIVRCYLHWEPIKTSAEAIGITEGLYRVVLHRARRRVWDYIEGALQHRRACVAT